MDLKICFTSTQNTFAWSNACHYNPQLTWNNWSVREETVPRHSAFHMDDGPSPISWGKHAMDMSLKHLSGTLGFLLRWIQNWRSLIKHRKSKQPEPPATNGAHHFLVSSLKEIRPIKHANSIYILEKKGVYYRIISTRAILLTWWQFCCCTFRRISLCSSKHDN